MIEITRIGRKQTPGERALMYAIEDDELLDALAENLCAHEGRGDYSQLARAERQHWRDRAVLVMQDQLKTEPPVTPDPEDPGGGEPAIPETDGYRALRIA